MYIYLFLFFMLAGEAVQGHQAEGEEQGGRPELSQKENGNYRGAPEPGIVIVSRECYISHLKGEVVTV
jgi:hypothetical protein